MNIPHKAMITPVRTLIAASMLLLSACFGSGAVLLASGGIGGTGMSLGPILLFGSVWVNGVEYDTADAEIYVENTRVTTGDSQIQDFLAVGQMVRVEGTNHGDGTGTADRVYFNDNVEGPVTARVVIDANTLVLTVLGQSVIADDQTHISDANGTVLTLADLAVNNVLEVSGLIDQDGTIHATFIRQKSATWSAGDAFELKGVVQTLTGDNTAGTFSINGLTVTYDASTDLDDEDLVDLGGMSMAEDALVEVKGTFDGAELSATRIEIETELEGDDDSEAEVQGLVTATTDLLTQNKFTLGFQVVQFDNNTEFEHGLETDISLGVHLEVEGVFQGGVLIADKIEFEDEAEARSTIASYDDSGEPRVLTLTGITGLTVHINQLTEIKGEAEDLNELDDLVNNAVTEIISDIRGRWDGGVLIATEIDVNATGDTSIEATLQGPLTNLSVPLITIMGADINTTIDVEEFEIDDTPVTQTGFLNAITAGDIIKAEGTLDTNSGVIDWDALELEGED